MSIDTVKKHIKNIKEKCGVKNKIKLTNLFRD
ncbi:MAG: hypothetical protein JXJ04_03475 [Spirochaetales bacterium]|nr:hypothetical protein [Spirochaetales bacterium]